MSLALMRAKQRLLLDRSEVNTRIVDVTTYCIDVMDGKRPEDDDFPLTLARLEVRWLQDVIDPELERQTERIRA